MPSIKSAPVKFYFRLMLILILGYPAWAASSGTAATANVFLWIPLLLLLAKISSLIEKIGQAAVLGEMLMGVLLGNLFLLGIDVLEPVKSNEIILFLAELGVVILLFQIGLESDITAMRKVGVPALLVAAIGVVAPFALGTYVVGPWLLPGLSNNAYLFLGATLTATSVGITARVFRDLKVLRSAEAQIVLGAAVIDDVLGLIILAVVSAIASVGAIGIADIGEITLKALLFLVGALIIGQRFAPLASRWLSRIHSGSGMKFTLLISFCLFFAWLAHWIGLAPIIGAFAAGLVLDEVQFSAFDKPKLNTELRQAAGNQSDTAQRVHATLAQHEKHNLEVLIEPLGHFLVPLFFIYTGMQVKLEVFFNPNILFTALAITALAFAGKIVSGLAAGPVNKWIVGWGMAPRGEVGLIFAVTGKAMGVINDEIFSVIVAVVILTTLLTPPILTMLIRRAAKRAT